MTTALHSHHSTNPGETRPWGRLRRSAAVAVIVAGAFVFPSTAAAAAETDLLKVIDTNVDFGGSSGLSATNLGVPLSSATAVWTSSPGFVSVKLTGAVYYDGPRTASGCASVRVSLYDQNGNRLVTNYSDKACRDGFGSFVGKNIAFTMSNPNGAKLRVVARHSTDAGVTWVEGKFTDVFLGA
jgi:hypothetical protein